MTSKIIKFIIEKIVRPKKSEKILFITDTIKKDLALPFFDYCVQAGQTTDLVIMLPTEADGQEPSSIVSLACQDADIIMVLTKWSITHTKSLQVAKKKGAKVITFPAVTEDILERCVPVDYKKIEKLTKILAGLISSKEKIAITTKVGTNLLISTKGFKARPMYGLARKGFHMNLPDGETSVGVSDANGVLVVDGSMPPDQTSKWGKIGLVKEPIKLTIKDCFVQKIEGEKEAKILSKILKFYGKSAYKIAELGIGANPKAKVSGNVTEDEKVLGTIHIALGNDTGLGGSNYAPIHLDGVILAPTLWINEKKIIEHGILKTR